VTPVSGNRYVADRIAGASFEVIDDSGHPLPLERPQQVCGFLRAWLQPAVR